MKNLTMGLLIISTFMIAFSSLLAEKKKYYELQSPYDFSYSISMNDDCCFDVIALNLIDTLDVEEGHDTHVFSIETRGIGDRQEYDGVEQIGGWLYGDSSVSFTYCPEDLYKYNDLSNYMLIIDFRCSGNGGHYPKSDTLFFDLTGCENSCICDNLTKENVSPDPPFNTEGPLFTYEPQPFDIRDCDGCFYKFKLSSYADVTLEKLKACFDDLTIETTNHTDYITITDHFDFDSFEDGSYSLCLVDGETAYYSYELSRETYDSTCYVDSTWIYYSPTDSTLVEEYICEYDTTITSCFWDGFVSCDTDSFPVMTPPDSASPCVPDCPEIPFIKGETGFIIINGCRIDYIFYWRNTNCDGEEHQDIQLTEYWMPNGCGGTLDDELIYAEIIRDIIQENTMNFEPISRALEYGEELCDTTWRIVMGSCWSERYLDSNEVVIYEDIIFGPGGEIIYDPDAIPQLPPGYENGYTQKYKCDTVDCCIQPIIVCNVGGAPGARTKIVPSEEYQNTVICDSIFDQYITSNDVTQQCHINIIPCEPACDWMSEAVNEHLYSEKIIINNENNEQGLIKYGIDDYHRNEMLTINTNCKKPSSISVHVYGADGKRVDLLVESNLQGIRELTINTNEYTTGAYYYTIIINNQIIKSNKFIIIR